MSLASKLTEERRGRLAAERLLELKQAELFAAKAKLGMHARQLSETIVETRAEVETIRGENQRVRSDLSAANERIALAERRLWYSIQTIKDGFAFFNADNEMIMANQAYLAVFDGLEEIKPGVNYVTILQAMTDEGIVNTGDLSPAAWRQMMTERLQQDRPEPTLIQLWNGRHVRMVDQRGPGGDMISLGLDITETVAYEEQLKQARHVAESANRAKSAFLANMSHEIRTPMNGVIGMVDLILETSLDSDQQMYVETIKNSAEALLLIINDVLDYSKIEADRLELRPQSFDLLKSVEEVIRLLDPSARGKGLALLLEYDPGLPDRLTGDPGRIRQVLTNLIGNAVKFTAAGHVLVRITGADSPVPDSLTLHVAVEDTGIGIPAEMVEHVFGEFNQVEGDRNRQFEGTGLGLAISQQLVRMMGGAISVRSGDGAGSCFEFELPLGLPGDAVLPDLTVPAWLGTVRVIDPDVTLRGIVMRQLERLGLEATGSTDPAEALVPGADVVLLAAGGSDVPALRDPLPGLPEVLLMQTGSDDAQTLPHPPSGSALLRALRALPHHPLALPSPAARKMRILAAEDNKTNQLVFAKMIKALDVDLTFANNGQEAVDLFRQIAPDLVFMDISMPVVDGKAATAAIRAEEGDRRTSIVALTAHALDGDEADFLAAGLDSHLTKPLRKPQIIAQIEAAHGPGMAPLRPDQDAG